VKGLTASRFEALLARLDPDRDRAAEKYELIRRKLTKFFEWNHCVAADLLVDETFDRVAQKCETEEILDPANFALGVARYVRLEARRRQGKESSLDATRGEPNVMNRTSVDHSPADRLDDERLLKCLRVCIGRLHVRERQLFLGFFDADTSRAQHRSRLAEHAGIKIGALRARICRLRGSLEDCVRDCYSGDRTSTGATKSLPIGGITGGQ
jgi:DNA-directed RNA polymerase specialized sigma24 family protein